MRIIAAGAGNASLGAAIISAPVGNAWVGLGGWLNTNIIAMAIGHASSFTARSVI